MKEKLNLLLASVEMDQATLIEIYRKHLEKNMEVGQVTPLIIFGNPEGKIPKLEPITIEVPKIEDIKMPDMPANRSERRQMKKGKSISKIRENKSKYIP